MAFVLPMGADFADGVELLPVQPAGAAGNPTIVGTPLPTAFFSIYGATGGSFDTGGSFVEELPGSPRIEQAQQTTCEHGLKMDVASALTYLDQLHLGTVVTDTDANLWRVLSSEYTHDSELHATLHYVLEALTFDTPPDDFDVVDEMLDLHIIKHPRYWRWLCPYAGDEATVQVGDRANVSVAQIKEAIIRMIQNYIESAFYPSQNMVNSLIQINIINQLQTGAIQFQWPNPAFDPSKTIVDPVTWDGNAVDQPKDNCAYFLISSLSVYEDDDPDTGPIHMAIAAAQELISKLWRQEDTPYITMYEVVLTQYFFQPVYINPGCYLEDPRDVVPSYFMAPGLTWPPTSAQLQPVPQGNPQAAPASVLSGGNLDKIAPVVSGYTTIFDLLVKINPQLYSSDGTDQGTLTISALRMPDRWHYERTWFGVTSRWKVACIGKYDPDLYQVLGGTMNPSGSTGGPTQVGDFNVNPNGQADI